MTNVENAPMHAAVNVVHSLGRMICRKFVLTQNATSYFQGASNDTVQRLASRNAGD